MQASGSEFKSPVLKQNATSATPALRGEGLGAGGSLGLISESVSANPLGPGSTTDCLKKQGAIQEDSADL